MDTNIYDEFIQHLRLKQYEPGDILEKHHILPRFKQGTNDANNILKISPEDHTLAHYYRFLVFQEKGDKLAYLMRKNQKNEASFIRSQLAVFSNKEKKQLFWDSKWQSCQGIKGGKIAGRKNTLLQQKARSVVGKQYGSKVGISNQSEELKFVLKRSMVWEYKTGLIVKTIPCKSFKQICEQLEKKIPNSIRNSLVFFNYYMVKKNNYMVGNF